MPIAIDPNVLTWMPTWLLLALSVPLIGAFWAPFAQWVIAPLVTTGFGLWGASKESSAQRYYADQSEQAAQNALDFQQRQEDRRQREYDAERDREYGFEDIDRERAEEDRQRNIRQEAVDRQREIQLNNYYLALARQRQVRLAPYRSSGAAAGNQLSGLLGLDTSGINFQPPPLPPAFTGVGTDAGSLVGDVPPGAARPAGWSPGVRPVAPAASTGALQPSSRPPGQRFQPREALALHRMGMVRTPALAGPGLLR